MHYREAQAGIDFKFGRSGGLLTGTATGQQLTGQSDETGPLRLPVNAEGLPVGADVQLRMRLLQLKIRTSEIALAESQGELLPRELIYRALFGRGQEIKNAFELISDRVIDGVLAALNRAAARAVFQMEVDNVLAQSDKLPEMDFQSRYGPPPTVSR